MNIFQSSCTYTYKNNAFLEILEKLGPCTDIFKKPYFNYLFVIPR